MELALGLIGVAVGAVITLFTGFQSRSWAHNEWLLNERSKVYGAVSDAYRTFTLDQNHDTAIEVLKAVWSIQMVSSRRVDVAGRAIAEFPLPADPDWVQFSSHMIDLIAAMSADLLYPPRTGLLPSEVRRR